MCCFINYDIKFKRRKVCHIMTYIMSHCETKTFLVSKKEHNLNCDMHCILMIFFFLKYKGIQLQKNQFHNTWQKMYNVNM